MESLSLIHEQLRSGHIDPEEALRRAADCAYPEYPNLEYILRRCAALFLAEEDARIEAEAEAEASEERACEAECAMEGAPPKTAKLS